MSLIGKKDVLGIDLGSKVIKILDLKVSPNKVSVQNYAEFDIGYQRIDEKSPEEKNQAYISAVKKLIGSKKFSTKNACISVSGSAVITFLNVESP